MTRRASEVSARPADGDSERCVEDVTVRMRKESPAVGLEMLFMDAQISRGEFLVSGYPHAIRVPDGVQFNSVPNGEHGENGEPSCEHPT